MEALSAGVRDYIHVVDLAKGHIAALKKLKEQCGCRVGSQERNWLESGVKGEHRVNDRFNTPFSWADLQPGHGHGLLRSADGPSHGEGLREEGRPHTPHTRSRHSSTALHVSARCL